jgi:P-type E1-E2 ATPase
MSLNVSRVWLLQDGQQILVQASEIQPGDQVVVHMGNVIPFDGTVTDGEAMVNQASMTGESLPVHKSTDSYVYAGTVVENGELTVCVKEAAGSGKYDRIVTMIEESEKLKSSLESKGSIWPIRWCRIPLQAPRSPGC